MPLHRHLGYIILNPYEESDWFAQFPKGDDMRLRLMCKAPDENSFVFFPEGHSITTYLEERIGHPICTYSSSFTSIDAAMKAIDEWAPLDKGRRYPIVPKDWSVADDFAAYSQLMIAILP